MAISSQTCGTIDILYYVVEPIFEPTIITSPVLITHQNWILCYVYVYYYFILFLSLLYLYFYLILFYFYHPHLITLVIITFQHTQVIIKHTLWLLYVLKSSHSCSFFHFVADEDLCGRNVLPSASFLAT